MTRIAAAAAIAAGLAAAGPAFANLEPLGPQTFSGTGLGAVFTVLTVQSPRNTTNESGSVSWSGLADVDSGDAQPGEGSQTRSLGEVGFSSAADIRIVFNAVEPGVDTSIRLEDLVLNIFSPAGLLLFSSGNAFPSMTFPDTNTGTGQSGFVYRLDTTQAAAAQLAAFGAGFGSNRIGLSAIASDAAGGPDTFFLVRGGGAVTPIPEPETYALMLAGLGVVGFIARRRKR